MKTDIVILAAGKGTRMKSALPKVLHQLAGRSLLQHVLDNARQLLGANITVVTGHGAQQVKDSVTDNAIHWVEQTEQLGTAHAVEQALPHLTDTGKTLVLYGDVPLIERATMEHLLALVSDKSLALLTVDLDDPTGYGRIVRQPGGEVAAIVEHKDASEEQRQIKEVNTGVLALNTADLKRWLPRVDNDNAQGEYYLTDLIAIARQEQHRVATLQPTCEEEVQGINDRLQLSRLERYYQQREAERLMRNGVTLADPSRIDVRGMLETGTDTVIDVNCVFAGNVQLGNNVIIGPNCVITNTLIGNGVEIKAHTVIEDAVVASNAIIGPYARLRPGTRLAEGAKIGNFVETKKAIIGKGSKVNHLSYIGDAELGENVNVGAGTITCNYDGANKFQTTIGDDAFIGSNSTLIAPVTINKRGFVAAGSTVNQDVPDDNLAVARGKQRNIDGWKRPSKKQKEN